MFRGQRGSRRPGLLVTSAFSSLRLVSLQLYSEGIKEGRQLNQREMADFLHVFHRQVSCFGQPKSGFLNNKFLKYTVKIFILQSNEYQDTITVSGSQNQ